MKKILIITLFIMGIPLCFSQVSISNVYVSSSTATTATIVWTTNVGSTSKIKYGFDPSLPFANNTDPSLVTSHSMTLILLTSLQPYYFAVVSGNGSSTATSATAQFALCGPSLVEVSGTINPFYGNGSYTFTWNPPAGAVSSPTVCGQPVTTTVTGKMNAFGSLNASVADSLKVTPGPGTWTVVATDAGNLSPVSITLPLYSTTQNISEQLTQAASTAGLVEVIANTNNSTVYPSFLQPSAPSCPISTGCTFLGPVTAPSFIGPLTGNASTSTAFFAVPSQCPGGQFATGIQADGTPNCSPVSGSGTVTPSPQFSVFYQPNSGSSGTAQGDNNFTTNGSGSLTAVTMTLGTGANTATGLQVPNSNAAVTTNSILAFGAKGDAVLKNSAGNFCVGTMTSGGTTMTVGNCQALTTSDVGKFVSVYLWNNQPFATGTYTGQSGWTTSNVAQITAFIDSTHVTLSKTALNNFSGDIIYGTDNTLAAQNCQQSSWLQGVLSGFQGGLCTSPAGQFLFATSNHYVLGGKTDNGGYETPAGGSGATITVTLGTGGTAGQIASYAVTGGGSGYTPNSSLVLSYSGGCTHVIECGQAYAYGITDAGGHVVSVTPVWPGYGFVSPPTVTATPIGGDGATAHTTISAGAITTPVVDSGAAGYLPSTAGPNWFALQGSSGCATIGGTGTGQSPFVAKGTSTTDATGAISTMTITTNTTGCATPPPIVFGNYACNSGTSGSPVWGQCTNLTPVPPTAFPVNVFLNPAVSFQGVSGAHSNATTWFGGWDVKTVDPTQPIGLGGFLSHADVSGITFVNSMMNMGAFNNFNNSHLYNLNFSSALGLYTSATDVMSIMDNLLFTVNGPINGGSWSHRSDAALGGGGFYDLNTATNITVNGQAYSALDSQLDDYMDQYFWASAYSANSGDFNETCKFPASPNQRQTSPSMTGFTKANTMCYPGATGFGIENLMRDGRSAGAGVVTYLDGKSIFRSLLYGDFGNMTFVHGGTEGATPIAGTGDPYRTATSLNGAIELTETGSSDGNPGGVSFKNFSPFYLSTINRYIWSITAQGDPSTASWDLLTGTAVTNLQPHQQTFAENSMDTVGVNLRPASAVATPANFYNGSNVLNGAIIAANSGLQFKVGPAGTLTDFFDITTNTTSVKNSPPNGSPGFTLTGTLLNGFGGTNTKPYFLQEPIGTTVPTTWSNGGTFHAINAPSGFAGNAYDFHVAGGASLYHVGSDGSVTTPYVLPQTIYSAAGTALPSCVTGLKGASAVVSDATGPTYGANYTSGGAVVSRVLCNGTNWTTQ